MPGFYHLSIKIGSRSSGRSAVAAAAYRSGTKIEDLETGIVADYTRKGGVLFSEIILPENAPAEYKNRAKLWNSVEEVERQKNAQLFREFEIAFPKELSRAQQIEAAMEFAKNRAAEGMIVDFSIHDPDKEISNPHVHIMCTTRSVLPDGRWAQKEKKDYVYERDGDGNRIPEIDPETGLQRVKIIRGEEQLQWKKVPEIDPKTGKQKVRVRKGKGEEKIWKRATVEANDWNRKEKAEEWRKDWADICNRYLAQEHQIDHRSYARQGIDKIPTVHEGFAARAMEERGVVAERCETNREIRRANTALERLKEEILAMVADLTQMIKEAVYGLRGRVGRVQTDFDRSTGYDGRPGKTDRDYGGTRGRDPRFEGHSFSADGGERSLEEIVTGVQGEIEAAERIKSEADGILAGIQVRHKERDERIRKLMERRSAAGAAGGTAGRDRGTAETSADAAIREAEAALRVAEAAEKGSAAERDYSIAERQNRDNERERLAATERAKAERRRRRRAERGRGDAR